jgi:colicin import membrane protein
VSDENGGRLLFAAEPVGYLAGKDAVLRPKEGRVMSVAERTLTGLREMPSNAGWLLSRARDRRRKVSAAVVDAAPGGGDSLEIRMKRAREAAERAREAEERAAEAGREAKERSEYVRQVNERGRARLAEVDRETSRWIKQRIAEAQKAAEERVERERQGAEEEAQEEREEVYAEVEEETENAQAEAEEAQGRAEALVGDATSKLAEARRLAEEAAEVARAAAEEAQRQAKQLAAEAEQQASDAQAQVEAAEQLREQPKATAKDTARRLEGNGTNGDLESYNKPELMELAASIGIEGRTNMSKGELVEAIAKASRSKR